MEAELFFTDRIFTIVLAFVALPALVFFKARFYKREAFNDNFLSRDSTDSIKGLAILVVVLHHLVQRTDDPGWAGEFTYLGYLAVALFFFLSGYGLAASLQNRNDGMRGFLQKRLSKVYIPFLCCNALFLLADFFIFDTPHDLGSTLLYLAGAWLIDDTLWFAVAILACYLLFYILFKCFSRNVASWILAAASAVCFVILNRAGAGVWWYNTLFCFPMGVMVALYYEKIVGTVRRFYPWVTCFSLVSFGLTYMLAHHADLQNGRNLVDTASSVCFVGAFLCLMQKLRIGSRPLSFIGGISFEIYLLHMLVYKLYFHFVHLKASITLLFYLLIVGLAAYLLNKLFRIVDFSRLGYRGRDASMNAPRGLSRQH